MARWYLESYLKQGNILRRIPISGFPFSVGRTDDHDLPLPSSDVSREHAVFVEVSNQLFLRDLNSTNGTFVNHKRIKDELPVDGGDVIHFAHLEFRLVDERPEMSRNDGEQTMMVSGALPERMPLGVRELRELLKADQIVPAFQAVVSPSGDLVAYEALGRGTHPKLPNNPGPLFRIAESANLAVELSEHFRDMGINSAAQAHVQVPILVNTHPQELETPSRLLRSLRDIRKKLPDLPLILEIHEEAVTDLAAMRRLCAALKSLDVGLAYDDFGAGQARLQELADAPPDIVKFDIALVRGLDKAPRQRVEMIQLLVNIVHCMDVKALAEGVAEPEEAEACVRLGFDLLQGFYYGRPTSLDHVGRH